MLAQVGMRLAIGVGPLLLLLCGLSGRHLFPAGPFQGLAHGARVQLLDGPSQDLLLGPPQQGGHARVDHQEPAVLALEGDGGGGVVDEALEPGLAFQQFLGLGLDHALQVLVEGLQAGLRLHLLGDVPGDLGETLELPLGVAQGVDGHVGQEPAAVLAQALPLAPADAFGARFLQGPLRRPVRHLVRGVETGHVPAQDLLGPVALEALGAGVPADHETARIQHEDGVVLDPFQHQPETRSCSPPGGSRPLGVRPVRRSGTGPGPGPGPGWGPRWILGVSRASRTAVPRLAAAVTVFTAPASRKAPCQVL